MSTKTPLASFTKHCLAGRATWLTGRQLRWPGWSRQERRCSPSTEWASRLPRGWSLGGRELGRLFTGEAFKARLWMETIHRAWDNVHKSVCKKITEWNLALLIFKASALWADAFYRSICPYVCLCVCLFVCSLLRYRLTVFLPPLPEVQCPSFIDIQNPWRKVMERNGLRFELFC